ncbi:MAG: 4Fe-4S dicluster domain-containing protein [Promethearchaeota archaeon]
MEVLDLNEVSMDLIEKINKHPLSGNNYFACMQCGRCVASCPAHKVNNKFNIRIINRRIMDGDMSLLSDEIIWDCFYCESCVNLCPRSNIDGYKTILILRDLALSEGHGLDHLKNVIPLMESYMEKGVITDGDSWLNDNAIKEIQKINELTGFNAKIKRLKDAIR